jgi:hypothetical protein
MTQLTDLELRHSMRHCSTDLARSLSAAMGGRCSVMELSVTLAERGILRVVQYWARPTR